jgi:hypothetical protein
MNDALRLKIAAQDIALHELNATSADIRASAELVVAATREIRTGVALRRESQRALRSTTAGIPAQPPATTGGDRT